MAALVLFAYFVGLLIFALNGIIFMGMKQQEYRIKAYEERLRRLYMRDALRLRRK